MMTLKTRFAAQNAKRLRTQMTDAERLLWSRLRNRGFMGFKFVRQFPIGRYIVDFACREKALIIEIDGGQHNDSESDTRRTAELTRQGYSVLRFWNNEVLANREGVLQAITDVLNGHPSPDLRFAPATLSPEGRGYRGANAATAKKRSAKTTLPSSPLRGEVGPQDRMRGEPEPRTPDEETRA